MNRGNWYKIIITILFLLIISYNISYRFHFFHIEDIWYIIHIAGHTAGYIGAFLILLSLLYIPRKRKWVKFGKMRHWLYFHIATGIAGPLLIFFHSYGKYYGVGGISLAFMWVVFLTGFVGQFLYRKLSDELELEILTKKTIEERLKKLQKKTEELKMNEIQLTAEVDNLSILAGFKELNKKILLRGKGLLSLPFFFNAFKSYWKYSRDINHLRRKINKNRKRELKVLQIKYDNLYRSLHIEKNTKTLMLMAEIYSIWRLVHVPFTYLMLILALIHIWTFIRY
ncbi:MAG: hypothetical protein ACE5WD_13455 [Candidatus Aminicenantia bacterium]